MISKKSMARTLKSFSHIEMIKTQNITDFGLLESFLGRTLILGLSPGDDINHLHTTKPFCVGRLQHVEDVKTFLRSYLDDDMLKEIGYVPSYCLDKTQWFIRYGRITCPNINSIMLTPDTMKVYHPKLVLVTN